MRQKLRPIRAFVALFVDGSPSVAFLTQRCKGVAAQSHWSVSPHDLRHMAASLMQAAGVPLQVVSELLGHANTDSMQQVYTHALDSEKSRATAYFDG